MKIVMLIGDLDQGGGEKNMALLCNEMMALGHEVQLITLSRLGPVEKLLNPGILKQCLQKEPGLDLRILPSLVKAVMQADVVHSHMMVGNFWGRWAAWISQKPVVVTHQNMVNHIRGPRWLSERWQSRLCDHHVAVAPEVGEDLCAHFGVEASQISHLPNVVEDPGPVVKKTKSQHGFIVGMAARLVPQKRHHVMLESLLKLPSHVQLWLAGDGPLRSSLEEKVKILKLGDRVRFLGALPFDEMDDFYQSIDVFCLVSSREGLPLSAVEAGKRGVPLILPDTGGSRLILEGNQGGWIASSQKECENILQALCLHPERCEQMGRTLASQLRKRFHPRDAAQRCVALYQSIGAGA